jgi:hypothetical protein
MTNAPIRGWPERARGGKVGHTSHKLTQGQIASIPLLLGQLGSNVRVARALDINESTVRHHLQKLSGEEWDRIREKQTDLAARESVDLLFTVLNLLPESLATANTRDLLGAYKLLREGSVALGGIGQSSAKDSSDLERFQLEAEVFRLRDEVKAAREREAESAEIERIDSGS